MAEEITAPLGLAPGQIAYGGLVLGAGTAWRWRQLDGWEDMPALDSGDVARPSRHGAWPGRDLAQPRVITLTGMILARREEVRHRLAELRSATAVAEDSADLRPLVINALGGELLAYARPTQRIISLARGARLGHIPFTVQWTAPDPVRYSPGLARVVIPPGATRAAPHNGTTPTRPRVTVYGPCTDPAVRLGDGRAVAFDLSLGAGEVLTIDCHTGTATLADGASALSALTVDSVPVEGWTLAPGGDSRITFEASGASSSTRAQVTYRHAYL